MNAPAPTRTERIAELQRELRAIAWVLAELGVPGEVIGQEVRAGIIQAAEHRSRAGR